MSDDNNETEVKPTEVKDFKQETSSEGMFSTKPKEDVKATVKMLSNVKHGPKKDLLLFYDVKERSQVYLVPMDKVEFSWREQKVSLSVLMQCEQPYNWDEEIRPYMVSMDDVRLALYRAGLIKPDDNLDKKFLQSLFKMGLLPITENKE